MQLSTRSRSALVGVAVSGVLAATAVSSATATAHPAPYNQHDVTFVQMMLPHHQLAIDMADVARTKAMEPAVRQLASKIATAKSAEVTRLRRLLIKMHGRPMSTPSSIEQMERQDMAMLRMVKGMHVDQMFLMMARPHHAQAVDESRDELINGVSGAVRTMASNIRTGQLQEITYMNELLAGNIAGDIVGVRSYPNLPSNHVTGTVHYPQTPPAGGNHAPVPLTCGVYGQPVPNENAVHSLEHGALWITYRPGLPNNQLTKLVALVRGNDHRLLSPYPGLPAPIVATAWGVQLFVKSARDPRLAKFVKVYTQGPTTPEPDAACQGIGSPTG
jgi:uncharacterized protein (DUF305 family)